MKVAKIVKSHSKQVHDLQVEIRRLQEENNDLRKKIGFLQAHPTIARGLRGETIVAKIVQGRRSEKGLPYDVFLNKFSIRLEVKFSELNVAVRGRNTKRWVWTKLFGESGRKRFDRLILVGNSDDRFSGLYKDPKAPFILFDVPFREVQSLSVPVQRGKYTAIFLTTNPRTVRSGTAWHLYRRYQVTARELERRYSQG